MSKTSTRGRPASRSTVTVVALEADRVRVLQAGVQNGAIAAHRHGSSPCDAAGSPGAAARAKAVQKALVEAGIAERRVVVCLPSEAVALRRVVLPPAAPEQLPQLVAFEAQRHLPLPLDQLASGYQTAGARRGPDGAAGVEVLLAVARKSELSALERALASAGISVEGYGIDSLAVADALLPRERGANGEARLLIAADRRGAYAQILAGDRTLFNRYLTGNGEGWTGELRRSLAAYSLEYPEAPVREVLLFGEGDAPAIERATGVAVQRVRGATASGGLGAEWSPLIGLGAQWLGLGQLPLRIPPQGWEGAGQARGRWGALGLLASGLAVAALLAVWQVDRRNAARAVLAEVEREAGRTQKLEREIGFLTRERDALRRQAAAVTGGSGAAPAAREPLELLRRVAGRAPAGVWLTQMTYQAHRPLRLQGTARDAAQVPLFVRALDRSGVFREVELDFLRSATVDEVPVTQFSIRCALPGEEGLMGDDGLPGGAEEAP